MAEVFRLFPSPDDDRDIKRKIGTFCKHMQIEYCVSQRTLRCRTCGADLDPFDTIAAVFADWERWKSWAAALKRDAEKAKRDLDDLKRQIKNAKAAGRRAVRDG
jgi:hypothetical protein